MRKSTKAILIALAVLIGPTIYSGYLIYRESKQVDVVTITVVDETGHRGIEGKSVLLRPLGNGKQETFIAITNTDRRGIARFYKILPGTYEISLLYTEECNFFITELKGVRVDIFITLDETCAIDKITIPEKTAQSSFSF